MFIFCLKKFLFPLLVSSCFYVYAYSGDLQLEGISVSDHDQYRISLFFSLHGNVSFASQSKQASKIIQYFLAGIGFSPEKIWVNLSPDGSQRVIDNDLKLSYMGEDLLEQDLVLKKQGALLTDPSSLVGKIYWQKLHSFLDGKYKSKDRLVDTNCRMWIFPGSAKVSEHGNKAYVEKAKLDVDIESNLSYDKSSVEVLEEISRGTILPELRKEINEGENFKKLRTIYRALILATWYKHKFQSTMLMCHYADKNLTQGINKVPSEKAAGVYGQYKESLENGVYNRVVKERSICSNRIVRRRYFSGGFSLTSKNGKSLLGMLEVEPTLVDKICDVRVTYVLKLLYASSLPVGEKKALDILYSKIFDDPVPVVIPERLREDEQEHIGRMMKQMNKAGYYAMDDVAIKAEEEMAGFLGLKKDRDILLTTSGKESLGLLFRTFRNKFGDRREILCPSLAFEAVAEEIVNAGFIPRFVDIDPNTLNMDPEDLKSKLGRQTAAVLFVDNYGMPNDYTYVKSIIRKMAPQAVTLLDACESFGSTYYGANFGSDFDGVAFSFSFSKPSHSWGKGGGLVLRTTIMKGIKNDIRLGREASYRARRMEPFRAEALRLSLPRVEETIAGRRSVADHYNRDLSKIPGIRLQHEPEYACSVYTHYPIIVDPNIFGLSRDMLAQLLADQGIGSKVYFRPQHIRYPSGKAEKLPVTEDVGAKVLALPIGSNIGKADIDKIVGYIRWLHENKEKVLRISLERWLREMDQARVSGDGLFYRYFKDLVSQVRKVKPKAYRPIVRAHNFRRKVYQELTEGAPYKEKIDDFRKLSAMFTDAGMEELGGAYKRVAATMEEVSHAAVSAEFRPIAKSDTVLVIGANGFIGRNLIEAMLRDGYKSIIGIGMPGKSNSAPVVSYERDLPDSIKGKIKFYSMDLRDREKVKAVFLKHNIKAIVNASPYSDVAVVNSNPLYSAETIVGDGLAACLEQRVPFVQFNTALLYVPHDEKKNEAGLINPLQSVYTEMKFLMEYIARQSQASVLTIRLTNVYGPGEQKDRVIPIFAERAKSGKTLNAVREEREFIHIRDLCCIIEKILERNNNRGVLNVGSGEAIGIDRLAGKIANIAESESLVVVNPYRVGRRALDISELHRRIGNPENGFISIDSGLREEVSSTEREKEVGGLDFGGIKRFFSEGHNGQFEEYGTADKIIGIEPVIVNIENFR